MTPEQYIAEQTQAEVDLCKKKTEKAKSFRKRFFISLGSLFFVGGAIGAISGPEVIKIGMICLVFAGSELIFFQWSMDRKSKIPKEK